MTLRSAAARVRDAARRRRPLGEAERWRAYLAEVEPALAAQPRVHRFAAPPVLGDAATHAEPLALWIEGDSDAGDGDRAQRTRDALSGSTAPPVEVLHGPLREALAGTRAPRIVLVRAGDVLAPLALARLGQAAALAPDAEVITCDEDTLADGGARVAPRFRPGPSPDRWLACDDSGSTLAVSRTAALREIDAFQAGGRHALAVALAGPAGAGHAHVPMLLCHRGAGNERDDRVDAATVAAALARWEPDAEVQVMGDVRRVRRPIAGEPRVQVIVCFRDRAALTRRCVESLLAKTAWDRLGVTLVDNGSSEPATAELLQRLGGDARVTVMRDDRPFHFAALNNVAVRSAGDAELVVFLNNDTETIDPQWLQTLAEEAQRPEVGAVSPLLSYPDGTVQQAGAAVGLHGYAGHPFAGLAPDAPTPFGHATQGTRNWLAVSAACLMVRRSTFLDAGGFDERFVVAGNDVDLGLRLTAAGHRSLCVPHARMVHDESRSRGQHIDPGDFAASERSYGEFRTVGDPFYNPNLSLTATDCRVRAPGEGVG